MTTPSWRRGRAEATLAPEVVDRLARAEGVRAIDRLRQLSGEVNGRRVAVSGFDAARARGRRAGPARRRELGLPRWRGSRGRARCSSRSRWPGRAASRSGTGSRSQAILATRCRAEGAVASVHGGRRLPRLRHGARRGAHGSRHAGGALRPGPPHQRRALPRAGRRCGGGGGRAAGGLRRRCAAGALESHAPWRGARHLRADLRGDAPAAGDEPRGGGGGGHAGAARARPRARRRRSRCCARSAPRAGQVFLVFLGRRGAASR